MRFLSFLLCVGCLQAADIRVDTLQVLRPVNPNWRGLFLEEINHGGDGGLMAELVRNGSFAEAATLVGWSAFHEDASSIDCYFDTENPLSPAKGRSLRVEVATRGRARAGVANEGYWGVSVMAGEAYTFSLYARAKPGFAGPLLVSLEDEQGVSYASTTISGLTPDWRRQSVELRSTATNPAARLVVSTRESGTFWVNLVSLKPKGALFRSDLLKMLTDLRPSFLRFPGGTYVQGNDRASAFHWKTTLGDPVERTGHYNLPWVYWSSDALGFHEYLLLCEAIGARPLYVAYAGMSWVPDIRSPFGVLHQHRIPVNDLPMDQMTPVVSEAVDALEYANGPITSIWGAQRARAGHPEPFNISQVEVGNEDDRAPHYADRYQLIRDALKERFPSVKVIANAHPDNFLPVDTDLHDMHAYPSPAEALALARRIEERDPRTKPFCIGEFAVQSTAGFGNLRAALCEAVVLGAVERNTDRVPMICYAPLLANIHAVNWRPNLIYFDSSRSFGTPSYHVQKMFADSAVEQALPVATGSKDLVPSVSGRPVVENAGGALEISHEQYVESGDGFDYTVSVRRMDEGGLVVRFGRRADGGCDLAWMLGLKRHGGLVVWPMGGPQDAPVYSLETSVGGAIAPQVSGGIEPRRWYTLRIRGEGRKLYCSINDELVHEAVVPSSLGPSLYAFAGRAPSGELVLRIVNVAAESQEIDLAVEGAEATRYSASAVSLHSADLDAENTLKEPLRIAPVSHPTQTVGGRFRWQVEGCSFTVLTLHACE